MTSRKISFPWPNFYASRQSMLVCNHGRNLRQNPIHYFTAFLTTLLLMITCLLYGQPHVFEVDDSYVERNFMPYELEFYLDTTNALSFYQISANSFSNRFQAHPTYQNKDFKCNASYWIRLPIRHKAETGKVWLLEFYDQTIDHIEAYVPQENGSYTSMMMGDSQPFPQRTLRHKNCRAW